MEALQDQFRSHPSTIIEEEVNMSHKISFGMCCVCALLSGCSVSAKPFKESALEYLICQLFNKFKITVKKTLSLGLTLMIKPIVSLPATLVHNENG